MKQILISLALVFFLVGVAHGGLLVSFFDNWANGG